MADLTELFSEISADQPCGENLEYDNARIALDNDIEGTPENQFTGEVAQPPNWREIQKSATALLKRSKDLQVYLHLIRALLSQEGIIGFRDGLKLLDHALQNYWQDIHPQLDPDDDLDPTLRVNIIEGLCSQELILNSLSLAYLVESRSLGRFSFRDIQYSTDKIPAPETITKPESNTIKSAFLDADAEVINATHLAIIDSISLTQNIEKVVSDAVGITNGPNLLAARSLLKELLHGFEQMAGSTLAGDNVENEADIGGEGLVANDDARTNSVQPRGVGQITNRQDVVKAIDAICKYYSESEPSSPVPIFLNRAKFLVTADFAAIVQNILPDGQSQLDMILGPESDRVS